jgi:DHA1 family putative efflux transporter-like MFS transporter
MPPANQGFGSAGEFRAEFKHLIMIMKKATLTLMVFTLMSFVTAMTAFVFTGILDQVAISLNISIADSGLLNTMYAYGAALGAPIILILCGRIDRARMLKIMLLITILTTSVLIYAQNFGQLLIIRLAMGITASSYSVLAISIVVSLTTKERQGRSLAILIAGSSLALVIGIPLTRALSSVFDWRGIFRILNTVMIVSLIYFIKNLPKGEFISIKLNLKDEFKFFKDGKTLLIITYTLIMFVGYYALFNYITPYLLHLFPSIETIMPFILVLLGIGCFTGNLIGGNVSDRIGYSRSLLMGGVLQLVSIVLLLVFQRVMWLSVALAILWIMIAWFIGLQVNTGIAQVTQNKSSFMISINSSANQLGSAIGSSLAAIVIPLKGIESIIFIPLIACLGIILIQWVSINRVVQ